MAEDTLIEFQFPSDGTSSRSATASRLGGGGGGSLAHLANSLKMLCEHNRMRILCFLMQGERGVCDLADCLGLPQNLVSHHLAVLRELDLVTARRDEHDARCLYYSVDRSALAQLNALYFSFFTAGRDGPWRPDCCSDGECCAECRATGVC